jgi:membrane-associated phospholipid phosphatase
LFVAIISVTALEILIKIFYKNRRPDFSAKQQTAYSRFEAGASFPSGHTGKITLFTTMLHGFYGNAPITALFIVIAVFVGISRIKLHRHYLSDVIGGYILGFIFGWLFS